MSCQTIGAIGRALCKTSRKTTCTASKIPAFTCGSLASSGLTLNGQKNNENGANVAQSSDTKVSGSAGHSTPASHRLQHGKKRGEELLARSGRAYSSTAPEVKTKNYLWARYNEMKRLVHGTVDCLCSLFLLYVCHMLFLVKQTMFGEAPSQLHHAMILCKKRSYNSKFALLRKLRECECEWQWKLSGSGAFK